MILTPPPTAPLPTDTTTVFDTRSFALAAWYATHVSELTTLLAGMSAVAAGGAFSIAYTFSTATADVDPTAGHLALDNATQSAAATIRADPLDQNGSNWTDAINFFANSTGTVKGLIRLMKQTDATKWVVFAVTGVASPTGYKNIAVTPVTASTTNPFVNGDPILLDFTPVGPKGDPGKNAGLAYVYSSTTTATDPTAGKLQFDNATLALAIELYISETDADTNAIAAEIATWDDSTATIKATIKVYKNTDPTKFASFHVTGTNTDNGAWDTVNLTYVDGPGGFTNGDAVT
ncbi:MAG: hypothetical protein NT159_00505, partial [Proteobacteria bacterium]|nr:hypothetical protein [Pseudomonadota bacterium]